jgi:predicted AAA+ superfamily ATPase
MIKRFLQNELEYLIANFPAVGVIGPRQVGKTTLVKECFKEMQDFLYLDLEKNSDRAKLNNAEFFLQSQSHKCVILDEIQFMPQLFPLLRALIDEDRRPGRFIVLGSASPFLLRQSSESLAGRIAYLQLHPINWLEAKAQLNWTDLWTYGGFPEPVVKNNLKFNKRWQQNFIDNYIQRDLPSYGLAANPTLSYRFLQMLVSGQAQTINFSSYAKSIGVSVPTAKTYFYFYENALLVYSLQPWFQNSKKRLVKSSKIYFSDLGMLHHLLGIFNYSGLLAHLVVGNSWENFVINQVKSILPSAVQLYFYRTQDGAEIDLLARHNNKWLWGAEIKLSTSPTLSKGTFLAMADLGLENLYVIIPQGDTFQQSDKISVIGLENFLLKCIQDFKD